MDFGITVDYSFWNWFINLPTFEAAAVLFALGGWVFISFYFLKIGVDLWVAYRVSTKYVSQWNWVLLAVDVPPLFIQTPKAVEQIFAHLSGASTHSNVYDKYWLGKKQKSFSFEVVSIEGYIQFLIRTEAEFRDLVEASVYAQYPEAEITEVEDYVENIPSRYPDGEYDVMGVEFKLSQDSAFPIRTYPDFAYSLSKDAVFSDPMAAILENFTRISEGENLWMQIVIEPTDSSWKEKGIELAKGILKGGAGGHGHGHGGGGLFTVLLSGILDLVKEFIAHVVGSGAGAHDEHEKEEKPDVTSGDRKNVEAIEAKLAKIGFKTKLRVLYAAKFDVYHPNRCLDGTVGAMNQFHIQNRNAIVPFAATHAHYDPHHVKSYKMKNGFIKSYKGRKLKWSKCDAYIMNIEELATIWHFPLPFVKTPLLHKSGYKRAEPPSGLPIEQKESPIKPKLPPGEGLQPEHELPAPPEDLPYG